jgi:hypothetical protein
MTALGLLPFTFDFQDGSGPLTFYARRMSARERMQVEAVRQTRMVATPSGNAVEVIANPTEVVTTAFIIRARDSIGGRLFFQPADAARVWDLYNPEVITAAVVALNALDNEPGNG